jgi:1-acyl-sn-glycerol-3-phosphate acyltransferase
MESNQAEKKSKTSSKKNKKWIRPRHKVVRNILYYTLGTYCKLSYNAKVEKFKEWEDRPYCILLNHVTPFDQFFVGMSVKGNIYYLATEDIFSKGWVSDLIRWLIAPIPIKKQASDVRAVMTCIRVAREGGSICIAPEGNRTYSGRTEYMSPAIIPLAKKMGMPILLYRLEGGYGVMPRWGDVVRRGKMRCYVSRVIMPEEYKDMTDDELYEAVKEGLHVNEACVDGTYRHKKRAEYLERLLYVCPFCGLSSFESHKDTVTCLSCGRKATYTVTKELEGDFPYRFVADWYDAQEAFINQLDVTEKAEPLYVEKARLSEVIAYERKVILDKEAVVELYGHSIVLKYGGEEKIFSFDELLAVTVLGRNKLNMYFGDKIFQLKGSKRFNAVKYMHLFHRYKNLKRGNENEQFLGL